MGGNVSDGVRTARLSGENRGMGDDEKTQDGPETDSGGNTINHPFTPGDVEAPRQAVEGQRPGE